MHLEESLCSLPDILHGIRSIVQADIRAKQLDSTIEQWTYSVRTSTAPPAAEPSCS